MTIWGSVPKRPQVEMPVAELHRGEKLAWTETAYGMTNNVSVVHRVFDDHAYCGEWIPDPRRHLPKHLLNTLRPCLPCQHLYEQQMLDEARASA